MKDQVQNVENAHIYSGATEIDAFGTHEQLRELTYVMSLRSAYTAIDVSGLEYFGPTEALSRYIATLEQAHDDYDPSYRVQDGYANYLGFEGGREAATLFPPSHVASRTPATTNSMCIESLGSRNVAGSIWRGMTPDRDFTINCFRNDAIGLLSVKARKLAKLPGADTDAALAAVAKNIGKIGRVSFTGYAPDVRARTISDDRGQIRSGDLISEDFLLALSRRFPEVAFAATSERREGSEMTARPLTGDTKIVEHSAGLGLIVTGGKLVSVIEFGDENRIGDGPYAPTRADEAKHGANGHRFRRLFSGKDDDTNAVVKLTDGPLRAAKVVYHDDFDVYIDNRPTLRPGILFDSSTCLYTETSTGEVFVTFNTASQALKRHLHCEGLLLACDAAGKPRPADPQGAGVNLAHRAGPDCLIGFEGSLDPDAINRRSTPGAMSILDALIATGPDESLCDDYCSSNGLDAPLAATRNCLRELMALALASSESGSESGTEQPEVMDEAETNAADAVTDAADTLSDSSRSFLSRPRMSRLMELCVSNEEIPGLLADPTSRLANGQHVLSQLITHVARMHSSAPGGSGLHDSEGHAILRDSMGASGPALVALGLDRVLDRILDRVIDRVIDRAIGRAIGRVPGRDLWASLNVTGAQISEFLQSGRAVVGTRDPEVPGLAQAHGDDWKIDLAIALCTIPSAKAWDLALHLGVPVKFLAGCAGERPDSLRLFAESWGPSRGIVPVSNGIPDITAALSFMAPSPSIEPGSLPFPEGVSVALETTINGTLKKLCGLREVTLESPYVLRAAGGYSVFELSEVSEHNEIGPYELRLEHGRLLVRQEIESLRLRNLMQTGIADGRGAAEIVRPKRRNPGL